MNNLLTIASDPDIPGQHEPTGRHQTPACQLEKNLDMAQAQEPA